MLELYLSTVSTTVFFVRGYKSYTQFCRRVHLACRQLRHYPPEFRSATDGVGGLPEHVVLEETGRDEPMQ